MLLPVLHINSCQLGIIQDQQVLSVLLFSCFGEVEAAGNHRLPVNDHHLVVSDRVPVIDEDRDTGIGQKGSSGVPLGALALVQNRYDLQSALVCLHESLGDRCGGERVGLDVDGLLGLADGTDYGILTAARWAEIDLCRSILQDEVEGPRRCCESEEQREEEG